MVTKQCNIEIAFQIKILKSLICRYSKRSVHCPSWNLQFKKKVSDLQSEGKTQGKHVLHWVGMKKQTHPLEAKTKFADFNVMDAIAQSAHCVVTGV